jgi:hypothetical protein
MFVAQFAVLFAQREWINKKEAPKLTGYFI